VGFLGNKNHPERPAENLGFVVLFLGVVMRKKFALLGATIVVCLVARPALAGKEDVGQSFKQAAMALEQTDMNARSAEDVGRSFEAAAMAIEQTDMNTNLVLANSQDVGHLFKLAALNLEKDNAISSLAVWMDGKNEIITGSLGPMAIVKMVSKKPAKRRVSERLVAKINLSSQTMNIMVDGKLKHSWKISSGAKGYHTPRGSYKPYYLTSMHYSKKYDNAPMPHSVFFRGGFAVHATGSIKRLGSPASHGCVRLSPTNAKQFFKLVQKYKKAGTRIKIAGSTPATRSYKRYANRTVRRTRRNTSWENLQGYGNTYVSSNTRVRRISIRRSDRRSNGTLFGW
jgi:lipoprotein-anchoring transpeptidase ErfK/SrfK